MKHFQALIFYLFSFFVSSANTQTLESVYDSANHYFDRAEYSEALKHYLQALAIAEKQGDCKDKAIALLRVGKGYYYLQDKAKAVEWFHKSYRLTKECKLDSIQALVCRNLGAINCEWGKVDSSEFYLSKAEKILLSYNSVRDLATLYAIYFELYHKYTKERTKAEHYLGLCEKYSLATNDSNQIAFSYIKKGIYLMDIERCEEAENVLKEAKKIYEALDGIEGVMYAVTCIATAQSRCEKADKMLETMFEYERLRDSVFKKTAAESMAKYQIIYDTQKKEIENLELKQKNQQLWFIFVVAILLIVSSGYFIYRQIESRKRNEFENRLRAEQRHRFFEVVQAQEKERARIAAELHDGIGHLVCAAKLNMSAVNAADAESSEILENALNIIDDAAKEVREISHNIMPLALSELGLIPAIRELIYRLNKPGTVEIKFKFSPEKIQLQDNLSVALFRTVQEILNNMIKHASASLIEISLKADDKTISLKLSDNGKGFNVAEIAKSEGLGWKNIKSKIEIFNGEFQLLSASGRGTQVYILIPIQFIPS
jgi:signal transduction histidine kinase